MIAMIMLLIVLILCVGFFTSSETAFLSLSRLQLRSMLDSKTANARLVSHLKEKMDVLLTTVLIGTNLLNSLTSALATAFAINLFGSARAKLVPLVVTFFITTFGQIIPKTLASIYPKNVCSFSSVPLAVLEKLLFPVVWLFRLLSSAVVRVAERSLKPVGPIITEEELKTLIDVGATEGTLLKAQSLMLNKIIEFNDLSVNDIMKHRSVVKMVSVEADHNQVIQEFISSGFSTLTVYKETTENVAGVLNYKTVLLCSDKEDLGPGFAGRKMSEVLYVPGSLSVLEILQKFRNDEHKFAVVLNEQGQTSGIVTLEDIMRLVFDRMTDENSYDALPPEDKIKLISSDTFIVPGDMKLQDVNQILGLSLESETMNTVGGWLFEKFGYLPSVGNVLIDKNILFTAEDINQRRIISVRIKI